MAVEIRVPPLGESLVDAVVGVWLKQEGDSVSRGESLVELETDKVNLDVTAEDDGILSSITRQAGEVVAVGDVLGVVSSSNGASASAPAAAAEATAAEPAAAPVAAEPAPAPVAAAAPPAPAPAVAAPPTDGEGGGRAAPAVRRLAEEHHIDLHTIAGTGPGGRVTREDVLIVAARQAVQQGTPPAPQAPATPAPVTATAPAPHSPQPHRPGVHVPPPAARCLVDLLHPEEDGEPQRAANPAGGAADESVDGRLDAGDLR